jgi:hypothetical protein
MPERRPSKRAAKAPRPPRPGRRPHGARWTPEDASARPPVTEFPAPEHPATFTTVGDLRRTLEATGASWSVNEALKDTDPLPVHPLGGATEGLTPADEAGPLDWQDVMAVPPRNPLLMKRAIELKLVPSDAQEIVPLPPSVRPSKTTAKKTKKTTARSSKAGAPRARRPRSG